MDTICAYIENWLFGFCWAFQSFRKRCSQHQNRTTGAARSTTFPRTTPVRKLLERQSLRNPRSDPYGSGTPIPKPYGRKPVKAQYCAGYIISFNSSRNGTVENETNTANVASESERSEKIRKPRMNRNAQIRSCKYLGKLEVL